MIDQTVEILYEEGPCLAVLKPPGVLTQAVPGIDSLEVRIKAYLKQRDNKPGKVYLGVPHRLDRPASGVMLFARHVRATRRLADQFAGRLVRKVYWALVAGQVQPDQDTWVDYIRKIPDQARVELVSQQHPEGKRAVLRYRVAMRAGDTTLLQIELETGRTHQVRIQCAARGHSILGDEDYGSELSFGPRTENWRERAIALHAGRIEFQHPMTREGVVVVAPLPDFWPARLAAQCLSSPSDNRDG